MAWQKVCHCLSSSCSQKDSRGGQGGQTGQEILRDCSVTKSGARENSWRSQGGDVLWVWCHVPFPLCFVASCGRCEQRDFSRSQDIWYLRWTGIAQVFKQYSSISSDVPSDNNRYSLRPSTPIYGWWYFVMIHEGVGKSLSQLIPKFPPTTEAEVDALMDMKVRV